MKRLVAWVLTFAVVLIVAGGCSRRASEPQPPVKVSGPDRVQGMSEEELLEKIKPIPKAK